MASLEDLIETLTEEARDQRLREECHAFKLTTFQCLLGLKRVQRKVNRCFGCPKMMDENPDILKSISWVDEALQFLRPRYGNFSKGHTRLLVNLYVQLIDFRRRLVEFEMYQRIVGIDVRSILERERKCTGRRLEGQILEAMMETSKVLQTDFFVFARTSFFM